MVTDPGRALLTGLNTALTYGARRPDETLGAYRLANTNRLVTLNQAQSADFGLQRAMAGQFGVDILNNSDPGAAGETILNIPDNIDVTKLAQVFKENGGLMKYTDPKGNILTAKDLKISPAPDGAKDRYVIELQNQDGVYAPKTVGASQDPDDPVRVFTGEELRELGGATLSGLVVDSGRDVFQGRLLALAGANRIEAEAIALSNQMAEMNPAMAGQFLQTFKALPYEEKLKALQEFGVDTDAMVADATNALETTPKDTTPPSTPNTKSAAGFYTVDGVEAEAKRLNIMGGLVLTPGLKGQNTLTAKALAKEIQELEDSIGNNTASELRDIRAKQTALNDRIQAIFDNPDARSKSPTEKRLEAAQKRQRNRQTRLDDLLAGGATVDSTDVKNLQKQIANNAPMIEELQTKLKEEQGLPDDQLDVTNSVTGTNNQRVRLNDADMQSALRQQILNPTQEDYNVMRNLLQEKGIRTFSQVKEAVRTGRINKEEQVRLTSLIAVSQPTLTAGATKAKSPLDAYTAAMNEMEAGRMSPKDAETLRISAGNLRLSNKQFIRSLETAGSAADDKLIEEFKLQDGYLFDNMGRFKDSDEIDLTGSKGVVEAIALRSMSPDRAVRQSNTRGFYRALANDLGAFAQTEGPPGWGDFFMQYFQKDTAGVVGGFQDRMMIRNIGGRKALVFKNADGQTDQNFNIPFSDLKDRYSNNIVAMLERDIPLEPAPRK